MIAALAAMAAAVTCLLPPVDAPIHRPFVEPACQWCPGHRGVEYATRPGLPVRAAADGRVTFAGRVAGVQYVVLQHPGGLRTTYGQLAPSPNPVREGVSVRRGAVVGTTGGALHFGLRAGDRYLDPVPWLAARVGRPRLVPESGASRRKGGEARLSCPAGVRAPGWPR
jgi:murein DD-endopeptidase MepM/ murein hydrolase activator NlpD